MTRSDKRANRLLQETSPYLRQHAYNPVDWFPWGEEAFGKAGREDKPVFLSIGYSTCHWCHVMERESFEDEEVAKLLGREFVCIKVDREERPDIDSVYMGVCQALTGSGGWPLTVFLTPEGKPFFAGTYFPKHRRYGQMGLMELLELLAKKWRENREELVGSGERIAAALSAEAATSASMPDAAGVVKTAYRQLERSYDPEHGGFGGAPKFPMPHQLMFLLRCRYLGVGKDALEMVEKTLSHMYKGGIYDHVGGGISRYSTDARWLAPHFEKMLYDNALFLMALAECYQVTGEELYSGIVECTLRYVKREMTAPEGGFYSAQDADSEGEEGKYYTFSKEEILGVLGKEEGEEFCRRYGVGDAGNFEGKNILNLLHHTGAALPGRETERRLEALLRYRADRHTLHKDDKILTSWNALMMAACAKCYRAFGCREYLEPALDAYRFVTQKLIRGDGALTVSYRDGRTKGLGLLDDYAFLCWACLELYESTFEPGYLRHACSLMEQVFARFSRREGGFYLSPKDGETLLFRPMEQYDGAVPSGNSVAAVCLARLAALTGEDRWRRASQKQLESYAAAFREHPTAHTFALMALMQEALPSQELLCALGEEGERERLVLQWGGLYHPQTSIAVKSPVTKDALEALAPYTGAYPMGGGTAFYLCRNQSCSAPVHQWSEAVEMLDAKPGGPGSI